MSGEHCLKFFTVCWEQCIACVVVRKPNEGEITFLPLWLLKIASFSLKPGSEALCIHHTFLTVEIPIKMECFLSKESNI